MDRDTMYLLAALGALGAWWWWREQQRKAAPPAAAGRPRVDAVMHALLGPLPYIPLVQKGCNCAQDPSCCN